jgi:pantoate--beta-alanine ligase
MFVAETVEAMRAQTTAWRSDAEQIVFVPTMGNLHQGHLRLLRTAYDRGGRVVASIYVNPMQFDRHDDFERYPRTRDDDLRALESAGVDLVFLPTDHEMYPRPLAQMTYVQVPELGDILEGASRPGHFRGVTTVVARLFNLVQPDAAVFGKKDYQQLMIIRRMVNDLGMPVDIIGVDTVREESGLAMSSRNNYLTAEESSRAAQLYTILKQCRGQLIDQKQSIQQIEAAGSRTLENLGFRPDYISIRRQRDLGIPQAGDGELVILAAVWLGKARLIDNLELSLNPAP